MIHLEDITTGLALTGLEPAVIGSVEAVAGQWNEHRPALRSAVAPLPLIVVD
jgi:hypothetical protein